MKDVKEMTSAEKRELVKLLLPDIAEELMLTTKVIANDGTRAHVLPVRFLNTHQISAESRQTLISTIETAQTASTVEEKLEAVIGGLETLKAIALGHNQ